MKSLLHIIASPRQEESWSLKVGKTVLARFRELYPDGAIDTLDLFKEKLPPMTYPAVSGKYQLLSGKNLEGPAIEAWKPIEQHIARFKAANVVLISTPMWNFGIPYVLKHYFDVIIQPGYLFKYTETGVVGMVPETRVIVTTARGGDYSPGSPAQGMDFLEPHLKTILGFIGVANPTMINVQPSLAGGAEIAEKKLQEAVLQVKSLSF